MSSPEKLKGFANHMRAGLSIRKAAKLVEMNPNSAARLVHEAGGKELFMITPITEKPSRPIKTPSEKPSVAKVLPKPNKVPQPKKPSLASRIKDHNQRHLSSEIKECLELASNGEKKRALATAYALINSVIIDERALHATGTYTLRARVLPPNSKPERDALVDALILRLRIPTAEGHAKQEALTKINDLKVAIGAFASGNFALSEEQIKSLKERGVDRVRIELTMNVWGTQSEAVRTLLDLPV